MEDDIYESISLTSVTRLAQSPRDLPVSVSVITRDMIDASGAVEIPDLFRLVAGFRVAIPDGGYYTVIGQGAGDQWGRKLEVFLDGLPVQSPVINYIDWLSLPVEVDDIDYIEVIRGSSVAVYGTNAFEGAINIVTTKAFEKKGLYARLLKGDPDLKGAELKYSFLTKNSSHAVSAYYKENSGFEALHDSSEYTKFRYKGNFNPLVNDEIQVHLGITTGFKQEDGDGLAFIDRPRNVDTNQQYIQWNHRYQNNNKLSVKAYRHAVEYDDTYETALLSEIFGLTPDQVPDFFGGRPDQAILFGFYSSNSTRYGVEIEQTYVMPSLQLNIGAGLIYDDLKSEFAFGDSQSSTGLNKQLFGNVEWRINTDFVFNTSAMIEAPRDQDAKLSPRVSLNYHLNQGNTFRMSAAKSYRTVNSYYAGLNISSHYTSDNTTFDKLADYRNYKRAESITSYEISQLISYSEYGLSFDWRLYNDKYDNKREGAKDLSIVDDLGDGATVIIDGGGYTVKGFQLQGQSKFNDSGLISFHYSLAESEGIILSETSPVKFKDYADVVPKKIYGLLISHRLINNVNIGINYSRVTDVTWEDFGDTIPGHKRLDLNLRTNFKMGNKNVKLEMIAQNVLGDYIEFNNDNVFDTRFLIRLSIENL